MQALAGQPCAAGMQLRQPHRAAPLSQQPIRRLARTAATAAARPYRQARPLRIVATYPEPETEKERSPIDFPQEWITPQPSRRPDIFPEFEKLETPMPKPMPGDPEVPDEEEEEEKKKKDPEKDPDEENPDEKPDEPQPDSPE